MEDNHLCLSINLYGISYESIMISLIRTLLTRVIGSGYSDNDLNNLAGVGFEHVGAKGQEIIQAVIGVAAANYPGKQCTYQRYHYKYG